MICHVDLWMILEDEIVTIRAYKLLPPEKIKMYDLARELHSRERRGNKCFDDASKIKLRFENESYCARIFILTRRKSQYPKGL